MTVLSLPAQPGHDQALRPLPWRRMAWVTWRQHRATMISLPALLAAVSVFLLVAGLKIRHDYTVLTACHPFTSGACQRLNSNFNQTDWSIGNTVLILMNLAPALLGVFAGAPVLARELETGTFRYAWTQGYGRVRWTIAKLTLLAVFVVAVTGAFSQLFTWFFQPFVAQEGLSVLSATVFATRGVVFAAWTLIAFAFGACFGMLFRRILPAMAVTLGVYIGLAVLTWGVLRKYYVPSVVTSGPVLGSGPITTQEPWVLSHWTTGSTQWVRYIPVSRYWPMQLIEGGWLLVLSALLIAATVWLVRRRAA